VRESDLVWMMGAGPEIGVASTKPFTCQLVALLLLHPTNVGWLRFIPSSLALFSHHVANQEISSRRKSEC